MSKLSPVGTAEDLASEVRFRKIQGEITFFAVNLKTYTEPEGNWTGCDCFSRAAYCFLTDG
jgi:hypothetical protein